MNFQRSGGINYIPGFVLDSLYPISPHEDGAGEALIDMAGMLRPYYSDNEGIARILKGLVCGPIDPAEIELAIEKSKAVDWGEKSSMVYAFPTLSKKNNSLKPPAFTRSSQRDGSITPQNEIEPNYVELLEDRKFVAENEPAQPKPILTLNGFSVLTPGNIANIQAQAKVGKSAVVGAILAATFNEDGDTLGFSGVNNDGKAVIHFDTEQSPSDHHALVKRSLLRAGLRNAPPWLCSYCVTDVSLKDRRKALEIELELENVLCGGVALLITDGIADFCASPNDEAESLALVAWLHELAIRFNCGVLTVLHENPGAWNDFGKTRGHLGSQLERKAETNLRLKKDADGVVTIFSTRARHANIPENLGPRFAWDPVNEMHVSVPSVRSGKEETRREQLKELAEEIFRDAPANGGLSWSEVHNAIEQLEGVKMPTARKHFQALRDCGAIIKKGDKYFCEK